MHMPLSQSVRNFPSSARDRKRLIEQSFYNQLYDAYLGNGDVRQNNVPDLEKGIIKNELQSLHQPSPICKNIKFEVSRPVDYDHGFESKAKYKPARHDRVYPLNPVEEKCAATIEQSETESSLNDEPQSYIPQTKRPDAYLSVLEGCLSNTGENAVGIAAIEIWTMEDSYLVRCQGGYWRDPVYPKTKLLERLENPYHPQHVRSMPLAPGFGTAGKLWVKVCGAPRLIKWVDLYRLALDDDNNSSPQNVSLNLFAQAFGLATGIYFHNTSTGTKGIVIFFARSTVDLNLVNSKSHQKYMRNSVDLIASVVSWKKPREEAIMARQEDFKRFWPGIKSKLLLLHSLGILSTALKDNSVSRSQKALVDKQRAEESRIENSRIVNLPKDDDDLSIRSQITNASIRAKSFLNEKRITTVSKMIKGGGKQPPRPLAKPQIIFAMLGCFLSLLTISAINEGIKHKSGGDLSIILGPIGALVTCHYGLTGSPAAQPRNSFGGILITSTIATTSAYIPVWVLPLWVRIPVVTSVGIATTLALGFAHPPAGAVAIIFAQEKEPLWESMGMLLFGYAEAIFFAMVFINLHQSATFPMYWGIPNPKEWFYGKPKPKIKALNELIFLR